MKNFGWGILKGTDNSVEKDTEREIILKWILRK
jgi:hypothetical protein